MNVMSPQFLRTILAARLHKVIPLLAIIIIASRAFGNTAVGLLFSSCLYTLCVITVGMHFNAVTDREVDKKTKPHLHKWTDGSSRVFRRLVVGELVVCLLLLFYIVASNLLLAVALLLLGVLSVVYSYNFFVPNRAGELRAKVHWAGHFATIWGSYVCLWLSGMACSSNGPPLTQAVPLAMTWGLVEYALFIHESANDADEEREAGLHTLPALIGRKGTSAVALGLLLLGAAGCVGMLTLLSSGRTFWLFVLLGLQFSGCIVSAVATFAGKNRSTEQLVDMIFWSSRAIPLIGLLTW